MTVKELIEILQNLPEEQQNAKVTIYDSKYERYCSPQEPSYRPNNNTINIYDI